MSIVRCEHGVKIAYQIWKVLWGIETHEARRLRACVPVDMEPGLRYNDRGKEGNGALGEVK